MAVTTEVNELGISAKAAIRHEISAMTVGAEIFVSTPCGAWLDRLPQALSLCRRAALLSLEQATSADAVPALASRDLVKEASVVLADDGFVRKLNRAYRGRDEATNVLSFATFDPSDPSCPLAHGEGADADDHPVLLGDVIIAFETVAAECENQGKSLEAHLCHMVVHGMLHLLGYDHADDGPATTMERLETSILECMGYPDPYAVESATI